MFIALTAYCGRSLISNIINQVGPTNSKNFVPFSGRGHVLVDPSDNLSNSECSGLEESFPWLTDEIGKPINYYKKVTGPEAEKILLRFLETKFNIDTTNLDLKFKLGGILKEIESGELTALDIFDRASSLHKNGKFEWQTCPSGHLNGLNLNDGIKPDVSHKQGLDETLVEQ